MKKRMNQSDLLTTINHIATVADIHPNQINYSSWYHDYACFEFRSRRSLAYIDDITLAVCAICRRFGWTYISITPLSSGVSVTISQSHMVSTSDARMPYFPSTDIIVYHCDQELMVSGYFSSKPGCSDQYRYVGHVSTEASGIRALERAFMDTQNMDEVWCEPPTRSTSVGDLLLNLDEAKLYMVRPVGFDEIVDLNLFATLISQFANKVTA